MNTPLARAALPVLAVCVFAGMTLAILATANGTWGYDFQAYVHAAQRLIDGQPLYDPTVNLAGGFAIYLYPPPFALAFVPFALLGDPAGLIVWTAILIGCTVGAIALMPVPTPMRWVLVLLAGIDWPVLYSLKLGQVGPILLLLFVLGWRWLDRPGRLGATIGIGTLIKLQPALLGGWAALTGRWGAVLFQAGVSAGLATVVQWAIVAATLVAVVVAARRLTSDASFVVAVVATQLVSPLLWDHYAIVLLMPVAWLAVNGARWALAIPVITSLPLLWLVPAAVYPILFIVALLAPFAVGRRVVAAT